MYRIFPGMLTHFGEQNNDWKNAEVADGVINRGTKEVTFTVTYTGGTGYRMIMTMLGGDLNGNYQQIGGSDGGPFFANYIGN